MTTTIHSARDAGTAARRAAALLATVRRESPLVHNITNYVVMNSTANAILAVGASPAMVHALEEVEDFAALARALVVNIGTLSTAWVEAMTRAATVARARGVPWILDPVGAGATTFRTTTAEALARLGPSVIRGNASEILAVAGAAGRPKGVDAADAAEQALDAASALARETGAVVAITGATDYVTDGTRLVSITNGVPLMARVTGLGCTATALVGTCCAVTPDALDAAVSALAILGVAGERAASVAAGPGSLQVALLDALHAMDEDTLVALARIAEVRR